MRKEYMLKLVFAVTVMGSIWAVLVFVLLRCANVVDWPVIWILSPIWIIGLLSLPTFLVFLAVSVHCELKEVKEGEANEI